MSKFDERKEKPFPLLLIVLSALALALTGIGHLFGPKQAFSPVITIGRAVSVAACVVIILGLTIPRAVHWIQVVIRNCAMRKRERAVLRQLKALVDELSDLFDPHRTHSLVHYIEDLAHRCIQNKEVHSKLQPVSKMLKILVRWQMLLRQSLQRSSSNHRGHGFQRTVYDVIYFHNSFGDVIREFEVIDVECDPGQLRNIESELIAVSKYNSYIDRLEVVIKDAQKIHSELPLGGFVRLPQPTGKPH